MVSSHAWCLHVLILQWSYLSFCLFYSGSLWVQAVSWTQWLTNSCLPIHPRMHQPTGQHLLNSRLNLNQSRAKRNRRAPSRRLNPTYRHKRGFFVQPESKSQNESCWCLNVGFRAAPDHKIDSVSRGLRRRLNKLDAKCGNLKFSIYEEKCDPSQFRFLEQSVGPDPNESKNLPCVSPATFAASDTNSGIRESGDQ